MAGASVEPGKGSTSAGVHSIQIRPILQRIPPNTPQYRQYHPTDDVRARKLQPIYNALDARNYKTAIKLCGKKDLEKWDVVKTLKAHALERLGRTEEALDLCREVKARRPTDDVVLSTLVMTFKVGRGPWPWDGGICTWRLRRHSDGN